MQLSKELNIAGRPLTEMLVRVKDDGDASGIAEQATGNDPDEIVVTGKSKKKSKYIISLGKAYIEGCSSITYNLKEREVTMMCLPDKAD